MHFGDLLSDGAELFALFSYDSSTLPYPQVEESLTTTK